MSCVLLKKIICKTLNDHFLIQFGHDFSQLAQFSQIFNILHFQFAIIKSLACTYKNCNGKIVGESLGSLILLMALQTIEQNIKQL